MVYCWEFFSETLIHKDHVIKKVCLDWKFPRINMSQGKLTLNDYIKLF